MIGKAFQISLLLGIAALAQPAIGAVPEPAANAAPPVEPESQAAGNAVDRADLQILLFLADVSVDELADLELIEAQELLEGTDLGAKNREDFQ